MTPHSPAAYIQAAQDFVDAYNGSPEALSRLNLHYHRSFTLDDLKAEIWRRDYAFRQRSSRVPQNYLPLEEAQIIVAQDAGYGSWEKLLAAVAAGAPPTPAYSLHPNHTAISPARRLSPSEWDDLIAVMKEHRIPALHSNGLITDDALARLSALDFLTTLNLDGAVELTDTGLRHLANCPQLQQLNLSAYPGGRLTASGLAVLRHLPNLRRFEMTWQSAISDEGVSNLRYCPLLEEVNLMGSPTGDGAVAALQGMAHLTRLSTGRLLTDHGIELLHHLPRFQHLSDTPARLLIDGPFSNAGLARLAGLDGLADLDLFWHVSNITSDAFAHFAALPNLATLACDGKLSDDTALTHIATIPGLKGLRIQESIATDAGFTALAKSQSLEGIWGRVCANFASQGFLAFSRMPRLNALGIDCRNVSDAALAALPDFPSLRELTPIGFSDDGFRHIGRCLPLTRLTCMYCRDTTDAATEHIQNLPNVTYYYAGLTQITDRSLQLLSRIHSLQQIDFYECQHITDAGLPYLTTLPNLRELHLDGLPNVTLPATKIFPPHVQVFYSA